MANQVLATFYVDSNYQISNYSNSISRTFTVLSQDNGAAAGNFTTSISESNVGGKYRYTITVERTETTFLGNTYYNLYRAGTCRVQLQVKATINSTAFTLNRYLHVTIQPDVRIYRNVNGTEVDMVKTVTASPISTNPLHQTKTVELVNTSGGSPDALAALAAREILINESISNGTVFIKSNVPVDAYCEDYSVVSSALWIKNKLNVTRSGTALNNPTIDTDPLTLEKYVEFIRNTGSLLRDTVTLGLEKRLLDIPLNVQSSLTLRNHTALGYTGNGTNTGSTGVSVDLPLSMELTTPHHINITPPVITLDEYNNNTAFFTVETNDDTAWTLQGIDPLELDVDRKSVV